MTDMSSPFTRRLPAGWKIGGLALLLFLVVFALFSPSLQYDLVDLDDSFYITNNPLLRDGLSLSALEQAFALDNVTATMYMPLLWISYMLDVEWLGATPGNPWGFHFTNVLLHSLNTVLLFLLLLAFCRKPWRAIFFAALWAIHPLRVESVAWVTERKDVLSGFFALLCVWFYWMAARRTSSSGRTHLFSTGVSALYATGCILLFALGLLTKPALVPLPLVLLALDFWPLRRFEFSLRSVKEVGPWILIEKIPLFVLSGLAAFGSIYTHRVVSGEIAVPFLFRLQSVLWTYGFYLWKTVLPRNLSVLYPPFSFGIPIAWRGPLLLGAGLLLLALSAMAWHNRIRFPNVLTGWLWFLLMLLPVCGIIPIPSNDVADRFTYFPAAGLSIALLFLLPSSLWTKRLWHGLRPSLALCVLSVLAFLTLRQLPVWRNANTLYAHMLTVLPTHPAALNTCASQWMLEHGNFEQADRLISEALRLHPQHRETIVNKAECLAALEGPSSALKFLQGFEEPTDRFTLCDWHEVQARYALMLGEHATALQHAEKALSLLPPGNRSRFPIALLAMTAAYDMGNPDLALPYARQFPAYADKSSLALADLLPYYLYQWIEGRRSDAYDFFQRLINAYPQDLSLLNNLAWGLATANWSPAPPDEVLVLARKVNEAFSSPNPGTLDTLAAAQANAGDFSSAAQTIQQAIALLPLTNDTHLIIFRKYLHQRLSLYQQNRPYREEAFSRLMASQFGKDLPLTEKETLP